MQLCAGGFGLCGIPERLIDAIRDAGVKDLTITALRFSPDGKYLSTVNMPKDSFPCDIYYLGKYAAVASLNNPDKTKGAAIYILENDQVISTILPKEELGLTQFMHIHNAVLRQIGKKYYVIAQAWNPGDFAILEQAQ